MLFVASCAFFRMLKTQLEININKMKIIFSLLVLLIYNVSFCQITITGTIEDSHTHEPIPFVHIYADEIGTASNIEGEFSINLNAFPTTLKISHISYEHKEITITQASTKPLVISLTMKSTQLADVFITPYNTEKIIERAVTKGLGEVVTKVKADLFYRQITTTNDMPTEMVEAFFEGTTSVAGLEKLKLVNGRFATVKADKKIIYPSFVNFYYFSTIPVVQLQINDFIFPVNKDYDNYYNYKISKLITSRDSIELAVINFTPKEASLTAMEGKLYVDLKTYDIVKLTGKINDDMGIQFEKDQITAENAVFSVDITFDRSKYKVPVLSEIKANLKFDMVDETSKKAVFVTSTLFAYNHYLNNQKKETARQDNKSNLLEDISKTKYKKKYWKDNAIIKRTLSEQNIVESFEESDLFKYQY